MLFTSALREASTAKMAFEQDTQTTDRTGRQHDTGALSCSTSRILAGQSNNHTPSVKTKNEIYFVKILRDLQQLVLKTAKTPFSIPTYTFSQ